MQNMNSKQILKEVSELIKQGNGRTEKTLKRYKESLNQFPEFKEEFTYGISLLEDIISLKIQISNKNKKDFSSFKKKLFISCISFVLISAILYVEAGINQKINGVNYISVSDNGIRMYDDNGKQIVIINDELRNRTATFDGSMMNNDNINAISRFVEYNGNTGTFAVSAITSQNDYRYNFSLAIAGSNYGSNRATQITGNETVLISSSKADMNFVNLYNQGYDWWGNPLNDKNISNVEKLMSLSKDGNLSVTGNIYANGTIDSENGIGVPVINAINISTDYLNADLVQSPLGKFENITGDKLNIDLIYVTDIVVDNLEVTDLITGSNAGTGLCVDVNGILCICDNCA